MTVSIPSKKTAFYCQEFLFNAENLAQKIEQESDSSLTGYWHHQFEDTENPLIHHNWYLGLLEGRVVFSDQQPLSLNSLLEIIERYSLRLRNGPPQEIIQSIRQRNGSDIQYRQSDMVPVLLKTLYESKLANPDEIGHAVRLKILEDLDRILFNCAGRAQFRAEVELPMQTPVLGFALSGLLIEAQRRKLIWDQVKLLIPSLKSGLAIDEDALQAMGLAPQQERYLRTLMAQGNNLEAIATALAQDTLETAKGLAKLVQKGLLKVQKSLQQAHSEILIIDDSPIILQQFRALVSHWGYQVRSHADPTTALHVMLETSPAIVFLDINMPEISGFDLLKQIRRYPQIAATPLVMLTAERTLSNNWRAQWSGCQFLSKPLSSAEISQFKAELRTLLESMVPLKSPYCP